MRATDISGVGSIDEIVEDDTNKKLICKIEDVLRSTEEMMRVASLSYRHQLGFMKYVLQTENQGASLRLHHWEEVGETEDIHSHCADFQSRIVSGGLTEETFVLCIGETHSRFRYRFDPVACHSVAVGDGYTGAVLQERRKLSAGSTYRKLATDLHRVYEVEAGTVTVSAWGRRDHEAIVLKSKKAAPADCVASAGISPSAVYQGLQKIKERLKSK